MLTENHNENKLVDTTDSLEALSVFRGWKNFLFIIILLALIVLQLSFWAFNLGIVEQHKKTQPKQTAGLAAQPEQKPAVEKPAEPNDPQTAPAQTQPQDVNMPETKADKIAQAAKQVAAEPNETQPKEDKNISDYIPFKIPADLFSSVIKITNFILIPAALLYCLTLLFSLKLSFFGRLGGINHISRAFFISLVMLILLLPWQLLFKNFTCGYMFTPAELIESQANITGIFTQIIFYLRYVVYWIVVLLFLIFAQSRSGRWSRTILRRLEVV